jgi:hypothetical protein
LSLLSVVDMLKKEFKTLGIPDILEMALLSSTGKVLYTDLSKATMSRISPFYNNILILGQGDNMSVTLDPVKTIVTSRISNKAFLIALTDKKVGIVITKMGAITDKYGRLIDEVIALEESKTAVAAAAHEAPPQVATPSSPPEPPAETAQPAPQPEPEEALEAPAPPPQPPAAVPTPSSEIVSIATKIIDDARIDGLTLRALGGVAIAMRCPSAWQPPLAREYPDIDLFAHAKDDINLKKMLKNLGYEPIKKFNALHGKKRLKFFDEKSGIGIDIHLDSFEMCHKLNFKDRLELDEYSIPLADLLMTKLQIVKLSDKDARDTITIIKDHDFGSGDPEKIDLDYVAKLCSDDWGLYKTLSLNVEKISSKLDDYGLKEQDAQMIKTRLTVFQKRLDDEPKSSKWQKRAAIGEKSKWYEDIE